VAIRRAEERPDEPSAASALSAADGNVDDRRTIFLDARLALPVFCVSSAPQ
jgi:hypothetical protein